jgi:hypothetical protein
VAVVGPSPVFSFQKWGVGLMRDSKAIAVAIDDACSSGLKQAGAKLEEQVANLNAAWDELENKLLDARSAPAEDFDFEMTSELTRREVDLLRRELVIRGEVTAVVKNLRRELEGLADAAHGNLEKAMAGVRTKLVKLGYHDVPITEVDPCKITPGFVASHPDVRAAAARVRELQDSSSHSGTLVANEAGVTLCKKRLETIKSRVLMNS